MVNEEWWASDAKDAKSQNGSNESSWSASVKPAPVHKNPNSHLFLSPFTLSFAQ